MKRRSRPGGEASKARGREALRTKRRDASECVLVRLHPGCRSRSAHPRTERGSEQQTATAEVLQVISSSPATLTSVFNDGGESRSNLSGHLWQHLSLGRQEFAPRRGQHTPRNFVETRASPGSHPGASDPVRMIMTKAAVHTCELRQMAMYIERRNPGIIAAVELAGYGHFWLSRC